MTTTATHDRISANANGTTPIPFNFQAASADEVAVLRNNLPEFSSYTVVVNPDGTGTVTPLTSWGTDPVVIYSSPTFQQPADFARFGPFFPDQMVPVIDRLTRYVIALRGRLSLTAPDNSLRADLAANGGDALVIAKRGEAGAVARSLQSKMRDIAHSSDFGITTTGDQGTKLTAFFNSANANPGVLHVLADGEFQTSIVLPTLNASFFNLVGGGCETRGDLAGERDGSWIRYIGIPTSTPLLTITSVSGAGNRRLTRGRFEGIGLDAGGLCDVALRMGSLYDCDIVTAPINATGTRAVDCVVVAALAETRTAQRNRIRLKLRQLGAQNDVLGIVLAGDATANWSMNNFQIDALHENAAVLLSDNIDNNDWDFFRAYCVPGGTATESVSLLGGASSPVTARAERFHFFSANKPAHVYGTAGYTVGSTNNYFFLDNDNGTPDPVIETGATSTFEKSSTPSPEAPWVAYTPTITAQSGTLTTVANRVGSYRKIGKIVQFKIRFDITTNGTGAGALVATLPIASVGSVGQVGVGKETALNNKMVSAFIGGGGVTTITIQNADGSYPGVNATSFTISGSYEVA